MRKFNLAILAVVSFVSLASAQCNNGRYASDVFANVTVTSNIVYGQNNTYTGASNVLKLDFYEPTGDTETARPLVIFAHGGSFIGGSSTDGDAVSICTALAKKGYACASINYRLGFFPFDSINAVKAVSRAVQDMKASIRFFYKDRKDGINMYKIDTNNIFVGGSSAGAITALHTAYLDKTCELNAYLTPSAITALGGVDGNSGNACYSTKIKGVINLCGALAIYGWMEAGDLPVCSMHGTNDGTVKYNRGIVNPGIPLIYLDGSRMVHERAVAVGVQSKFYTWLGAPHVPYAGTDAEALAYMDTTINFIRDYLVDRIGCTETPLQLPNATAETATLYPYTPCTTNADIDWCALAGIEENAKNIIQNVYPNPSNDLVHVELENKNTKHMIELLDLSGRIVHTAEIMNGTYTIEKGQLNAGTYILKVSNEYGQASVQSVLFY